MSLHYFPPSSRNCKAEQKQTANIFNCFHRPRAIMKQHVWRSHDFAPLDGIYCTSASLYGHKLFVSSVHFDIISCFLHFLSGVGVYERWSANFQISFFTFPFSPNCFFFLSCRACHGTHPSKLQAIFRNLAAFVCENLCVSLSISATVIGAKNCHMCYLLYCSIRRKRQLTNGTVGIIAVSHLWYN